MTESIRRRLSGKSLHKHGAFTEKSPVVGFRLENAQFFAAFFVGEIGEEAVDVVGLSEVEPTVLVAFVEGRVDHFQFGDTAVLVFLVGDLGMREQLD